MATDATDSPVRILHLSDIHFRVGTAWDADPMLRDLARFVAGEVAAGLAPDLVAVTGDLAFSGKPEDYALARTWLDQALWPILSEGPAQPLPRDRLLLVPGNHDVDRDAVGIVAQATQTALLEGRDQDRIAKLLGNATEREALLARHAAYLDFHARWLGARRARKGAVPWWQRLIEIRGQRLHVAGLDSAWMACGDSDRGRLLLARFQIHQSVLHPDGDAADWRLALLHHPWDYLAEFDAHESRQTVHLRRDLLLRGHLHAGEAAFVRPADPARACLELAAGCVYDGSRHPNAFQWIELWPRTQAEPRRVRVLFRAWVMGAWQIDRNQPGCPDGEAWFALDAMPGAAPKASPNPKAPTPGPVGAVPANASSAERNVPDCQTFDCFLSHNSKDKPAVRALAAALQAAGLSVWLDEDCLQPGLPWQPQLESGIAASRSVAVLVGADGLGPWEAEEQQAALALAVRDKRRPVIPVLLPDAPKAPELPLLLANRTWVDLRPAPGRDAAAGLKGLIWGITGKKPGASVADGPDSMPPPPSATALDDERFDGHWKAYRGRCLDFVAAALVKSPTLALAVSDALAESGRCTESDSLAKSDPRLARTIAGCLSDLDFDSLATLASAVYWRLRDLLDAADPSADDVSGGLEALRGILLRLAPVLYDRDLAHTAYVSSRNQEPARLPAALYTVAELAMAAEAGRAAAFHPRRDPADDEPRGIACLSIAAPEAGMDATPGADADRSARHMGRKELAPEIFRKDAFLSACDRCLDRYYPVGRLAPGFSDEAERLADRRQAIDSQLSAWPAEKDRPFQLYTVFRPKTLDELKEMSETATELHRRYPSLRILFLTACRSDPGGDYRWDLETRRLKGFCRILPYREPTPEAQRP